MEKKAHAHQVTLVSLKREIAEAGEEYRALSDAIFNKQKELKKLEDVLASKRAEVSMVAESTVDVINGGTSTLKDLVSRRKSIERTIEKLERLRHSIHVEVEEKTKSTNAPGLAFITSALKEIKDEFERTAKATEQTELKKKSLEKEIANLTDTNARLKLERKNNEIKLGNLVHEAKEVEAHRLQVLKELAREEAKTKAIRAHERDIKAMHRRLTDEYKKVYNSRPRRSTM